MSALRVGGYAAFFVFAFIVCMYWTFPLDVAKDRILQAASKQAKMNITAKSLESSWLTGVVAKGVKIEQTDSDEPIELSEVYARAHLLPFLTGGRGVTLNMPIAKGEIEADVVQSADGLDIVAEGESLELALIPGLAKAAGLPLAGELDLNIDLFAGTDPKTSEGVVKLKGSGLEVLKGGKIPIPKFGDFTVPELILGSFDWEIPITKGKAKFDKLELKGESLELTVDGDITVGNPLERSLVNLKIRFKPTAALQKKEAALVGVLNSALRRSKGSDGFFGYAVSGSAMRPRFIPQRR